MQADVGSSDDTCIQVDSDSEPEPAQIEDSYQPVSNRNADNLSRPLRLVDSLARIREAERIFSLATLVNQDEDADYDDDSCDSLASTDIINAMTRVSSTVPTDFISHSSIKKMGLALLSDDPLPSDKKIQYQVIINFKAALALGQQALPTETVAHHIQRIQKRKFQASLAALNKIGFCTRPSLSLLQAQCVGMSILQFFGNVAGAWHMMIAVARTLLALGYDPGKMHDDEEVVNCVNWCYRWDRSMSLFLPRPRLLPLSDWNREQDIYVSKRSSVYHLQNRVLHLVSQGLTGRDLARGIEKLDYDLRDTHIVSTSPSKINVIKRDQH